MLSSSTSIISPHQLLNRIVRVNRSGENAACRICEGQLLIFQSSRLSEKLKSNLLEEIH
ncbi:MAG: hypothetical protein MHMPM18_002609, partial [Marteilia pararefringens]